MDLGVLLEPTLDLPRLAEVLDGLGHEGRLHTVRGWGKRTQARLFEALKGFRPATAEAFVPAGVPEGTPVVHWGKNTLPAFSDFQKRFVKLPGVADLVGYNEGATRPLVGPGYYEARIEDGECVVDYTRLPARGAEGWPPVISNEARFGFLVWKGMVDFVRPLSAHVSVGRAAKVGRGGDVRAAKAMDAWFCLVREDAAP